MPLSRSKNSSKCNLNTNTNVTWLNFLSLKNSEHWSCEDQNARSGLANFRNTGVDFSSVFHTGSILTLKRLLQIHRRFGVKTSMLKAFLRQLEHGPIEVSLSGALPLDRE